MTDDRMYGLSDDDIRGMGEDLDTEWWDSYFKENTRSDDHPLAKRGSIDSMIGGDYGKANEKERPSFTMKRIEPKPKKDPEPVVGSDGKQRFAADIEKEIADVKRVAMDVEDHVKDITDPEAQAKEVRKLSDGWKRKLSALKKQLRDAEDYEDFVAEQREYRDYGMENEEGDRAVTELVDEQSRWYHEEVDKLKDELAARMRERLDKLNSEGHATPVSVRDFIYDDLVDNEVIENWEPLEF